MSEWKESEIRQIGNVVSGGTPSTSSSGFWGGDILFVTPVDLSKINGVYINETERKISIEGLQNSSANLLPIGSLVISSRAPIGYVGVARRELTTNQGCKSIIPNAGFNSEFLYYSLLFNVERIKRLGAGSTFAEISKWDLEKVKLPHPKDKSEQHKIARILSTCDAVIEKTQAAIDKYKAIKQGMLQDLFTRGIDPTTGRLRPRYEEAPELYKESKLGWIPGEWEVDTSGKVVKFINGRAYSILEWETSGIPVIRLQNLTGTGENYYYSNLKLPEEQYCIYGDLLYMWSATFGPYIWTGERAIYHYHIWKVECSDKSLQKYFYYDLLRFTETVLNGASGSTMAHITKEGMDKRLLILPSVPEQKIIADYLTAVDNKLQTEQSYLQKMLMLKKGLMGDLLSGKVKVKTEELVTENGN